MIRKDRVGIQTQDERFVKFDTDFFLFFRLVGRTEKAGPCLQRSFIQFGIGGYRSCRIELYRNFVFSDPEGTALHMFQCLMILACQFPDFQLMTDESLRELLA